MRSKRRARLIFMTQLLTGCLWNKVITFYHSCKWFEFISLLLYKFPNLPLLNRMDGWRVRGILHNAAWWCVVKSASLLFCFDPPLNTRSFIWRKRAFMYHHKSLAPGIWLYSILWRFHGSIGVFRESRERPSHWVAASNRFVFSAAMPLAPYKFNSHVRYCWAMSL